MHEHAFENFINNKKQQQKKTIASTVSKRIKDSLIHRWRETVFYSSVEAGLCVPEHD